MTAKTKHAFVDDNPYLVYSGDVDTSYNGDSGGGGGGGGGDAGVFWVEILGNRKDPSDWAINPASDANATTDFYLSATIEEIRAAVNAGKIVKAISHNQKSPNPNDTGNYIFDLCTYSTFSNNNVFKPIFVYTNVLKSGENLGYEAYIIDFAYGVDGYINQARRYAGTFPLTS